MSQDEVVFHYLQTESSKNTGQNEGNQGARKRGGVGSVTKAHLPQPLRARPLVAIPIADILGAGVMNADDDEDVLEVGADVLRGERQGSGLLEDDRHDVIPYVPLPQQLEAEGGGKGHRPALRSLPRLPCWLPMPTPSRGRRRALESGRPCPQLRALVPSHWGNGQSQEAPMSGP